MQPPPRQDLQVPLAHQLRSHLPAKIVTWLALATGICLPYFALQQLPAPASGWVPRLPLDAWVDFRPDWVLAYLSVGALVPLGPLCAGSQAELRRYGLGLAILCIPCFATFALYPVAGPRPPSPTDAPWIYQWLVAVDRPSNSMPSLHAGLVLYSLLYIDRVLRPLLPPERRALARGVGAAWGLAILYATLATKQHWAIDLPAGMLLAGLGHALAWRRP